MERGGHLYQTPEQPAAIEVMPKPEVLSKKYPLLVVDPYALNMIDRGPRLGKASRLSFYSSFILHAASELIEDGVAQRVAVFSDASFGEEFKSVGQLSRDYLTAKRPSEPIISPNRVVYFDEPDLNQTATQLKRLSKYLKDHDLEGQEILYISWPNHIERIRNHARGFGVNATVLDATYVHKYYEPKFDREKMMKVLAPALKQMEKNEKRRRWISKWDKKGRIPRLLKPVLGGSYMLDNRRTPKGDKILDYRKGKSRLREMGIKA